MRLAIDLGSTDDTVKMEKGRLRGYYLREIY